MNQTGSITKKEIIKGIVMTLLINGALPFIIKHLPLPIIGNTLTFGLR